MYCEKLKQEISMITTEQDAFIQFGKWIRNVSEIASSGGADEAIVFAQKEALKNSMSPREHEIAFRLQTSS